MYTLDLHELPNILNLSIINTLIDFLDLRENDFLWNLNTGTNLHVITNPDVTVYIHGVRVFCDPSASNID